MEEETAAALYLHVWLSASLFMCHLSDASSAKAHLSPSFWNTACAEAEALTHSHEKLHYNLKILSPAVVL